jgi:hypothetical protein
MSQIYTDPASGRRYEVDPGTGQSKWIDGAPPPGAPIPNQMNAQPVRKRRHGLRNTLIVIGVLMLIAIIASALNGGKSGTDNTVAQTGSSSASAPAAAGKSSTAPKPAVKKPGIGTPVRDGKFEFTVTKVAPPVAQIGDSVLTKKAQGQFVLVNVTVENIGDKSQMFDGSNQTLFDAKGRKFDADSSAAMYLGEQSNSFLNDINPGNKVSGVIVFDIPKGTVLDRLELHDSMLSGGVEVTLR